MRIIPTRCNLKPRTARCLAAAGRRIAALALVIGVTAASGSVAPAQTDGGMVYAVTYLDVSAAWIVQGVGLLKQYRDQVRHQAENLEFTVLQETNRPNRFVIVESWSDQAAFQAHEKSTDAKLFDFTLEAIRNSPPNQHVLRAFATAPPRGEVPAGAVYMVEHIDFPPSFNATGEPAVKALADASQKGNGVVRYDIYQEPPPHANHYSVVAVWTNRQTYDAHETAPSTRQFRTETAMPGRANLYDQRLYKILD
jgi:quinol monooxygenase YgiN